MGQRRRRELSFFPTLGSTCAYHFVASLILSRPLICFYSPFRVVLSIFLIVLEQAEASADNTLLDLNNSSYLCFLRKKRILSLIVIISFFRNFFHNKKQTDAEVLARMVEYVRKNVQHLETYSRDHLLFQSGKFTWLPFNEEHGDREEEKEQRW